MTRPRRLLLFLAVGLLLWPAAALAQTTTINPLQQTTPTTNQLTPFTPTAPATPTTTPTVTAANTSTTGGGLSSADAVLIGIGAIVVLGGICFYIWRDARKRAPVRHRPAAATAGAGSARQRQKSRKLSPAERKRRKRGKAR
jgi:hypothetical protein